MLGAVVLVSLIVIVVAAVAIAVVLLAPDDDDRADPAAAALRDRRPHLAARDPDLEDLTPLSRVRHRNPRLDGS